MRSLLACIAVCLVAAVDLPAGTHRILFLGSGWKVHRESVTVDPGQHLRHDVELERIVSSDQPVTFVLTNAEGRAVAGAELFVAFRSAGTTGGHGRGGSLHAPSVLCSLEQDRVALDGQARHLRDGSRVGR